MFTKLPYTREICKGYKEYHAKCIAYRMTGKQTQKHDNSVIIVQKVQSVSEKRCFVRADKFLHLIGWHVTGAP